MRAECQLLALGILHMSRRYILLMCMECGSDMVQLSQSGARDHFFCSFELQRREGAFGRGNFNEDVYWTSVNLDPLVVLSALQITFVGCHKAGL